jgi:integrase
MYARTRQEAARKLAEAVRLQSSGVSLPDDRMTVKDFLERWLEDSVKPRVRPWTYRGYEVHVRLHIVPGLGRDRLTRLTPQRVQAWMNERLRAGLSPKSVHYMRGTLRTALNQALRWGLVVRNVAALVDPPRSASGPTEVIPLSGDEARRFLEVIRGDRLEALYAVALALGLRQDEALGLTWGDVDFEAPRLTVRRSLQRVDGAYILLDTKTRFSRREVIMPATVKQRLYDHRVRQAKEQKAAGTRWRNEWNLVFTTAKGAPLHGSVVTHMFQTMMKAAGMRRLRFHDLRHSCDSLLQAQGVPPRIVMDILGHTTLAMTMERYAKALPEAKADAARRMDALMSGGDPVHDSERDRSQNRSQSA